MTYPETTDIDLKENVQSALEQQSRARSNDDALRGREYSIGNLFKDVTDGASVGILFEMPADASCFAFIDTRFSTTGKWYVQKIDEVTKDAAGTSIDPNNRLIADGEPCATGEFGASVSGGNEWSPKVVGSTAGVGGNLSLSPASSNGSAVIVQPGENVYFTAQNVSNGTADVSIDVDWTETPISEIESLVEGL